MGADVRLVVRRDSIIWNADPIADRRPLYQRVVRPMSNLGPGLGPWLYCNAPSWFYYLPRRIRVAKVKNALGPAGAWWLKDRVMGRLPILFGHSVQGAEKSRSRCLSAFASVER